MRNPILSLFLLLLCAPLAAQRIDDLPHAAAVVELAPATLDELARTAVAPPAGEHRERPRPARAARREATDAIVAELVPVPNAAAPPPPVTRGFRASFDPLPSATTGFEPADASGAVGPHHVVGAFNNSLSVHDRNGNQLLLPSIYQFWHDPSVPDTFLYDPRVMYDAVNDRWVLAMLTDTSGRQGVLLFAVSATGDPTGTWRRFRYAAAADPSLSLDFTRMALTADQIVITANEYAGDNPTGADVFTMAKSRAYSDTAVPAMTKTHSSPLFDLTPVTSSDTTVRILTQDGPDVLQYQLAFGVLDGAKRYSAPFGFDVGGSLCDQAGTTQPLECDASWLHYALVRDGVLWIVQSVSLARRVVLVWKISGTSARTFVIQDSAADYGYPSIAVNRLGAALVGYSTFDASIYPSAAYSYIDPSGNVSAPAAVKKGEDWYSFLRWGDYSSTLVDPADDMSFWTLQNYATPPFHGDHATWGTWWSYVQVKPAQRVRAVRH